MSIRVDTKAIFDAVSELQDVQHGDVWGAVLELQLRAEAIDNQKRELELMRLRVIKHTGTASLDKVEELLHEVSQTPEWQGLWSMRCHGFGLTPECRSECQKFAAAD